MVYNPKDKNPSGVVLFGNNGSDQVFESVTDFVYDTGNTRLGINTSSPQYTLDVSGTGTFHTIRFADGTEMITSGGGGGGTTYTAGSGLTLDGTEFNVFGGSGNFQYIELKSSTQDPQIYFLGSGSNDTPITLNILSSYQSASSSGSALVFDGTEGQLFAITDNLSSGVIFSVADIAGLPLIEADASGDVQLIEFGRYVGVGTGTPQYQLDVFGTGRFSEGIIFPDGNRQTIAYTGGGGAAYTAGTGLALVGNEFNTSGTGTFDALDMTPLANGSQPTHQEGVFFYDDEYKTLTLYNDEADISLQVGQEQYLRVRNNTTGTILNGEAVRILSAQGTHPTITKAIATSDANAQAIGLATHNIEVSTFGYITTYGVVRDINTSAYSSGQEIFLSPTISGGLTGTSPIAPNYKLSLGHVIRSHASNGTILVSPSTPKLGGGDVKSLGNFQESGVAFIDIVAGSDAAIISSNTGMLYDSGNQILQINAGGVRFPDGATQTIAYTGQTGDWKVGVSGLTDTITSGETVTFTGLGLTTVTYDASTNTVSISGAGDGSGGGGGGTPGGSDTQVQFNDGGSFGGDSNFTWDKSSDKLTISVNHINDALLLTSTEGSSDASPVLTLKRDSSTPADGDYLGQLKFKGESDTSVERVYAKITAKTLDVSNGTEDGLIEYMVREAGSNKIMSRFRGDSIRVLNGANFIAEGDGKVGVGDTSPTYQVDVVGTGNFTGGVRFPDGNVQVVAYTGGGGGTPGGSDTQVQFNDGGSTFGGNAGFTYDKTAQKMYSRSYYTNITDSGNITSSVILDLDQSNFHQVTLSGNPITIAVSNGDIGQRFIIRLKQDNTGSRTVNWFSNISWPGGGPPTLSTATGVADLLGFVVTAANEYDGFLMVSGIY